MTVHHHPIDIINLGYELSHKICFQHFSTRIHAGDKIALIGQNGSGKSTLLKLLIKNLAPTQGSIRVPSDIRMGYLPQEITFQETDSVWQAAIAQVQSVLDDVTMFERLTNVIQENKSPETSPELRDQLNQYDALLDKLITQDSFTLTNRIKSLLSQAQLDHLITTPVNQLSGGERMRLGLVTLLATQPNLLLLDEPTNHLDSLNRAQFLDFLKNWRGTALLVSHDIELLRTYPTSIWHIDNKSIQIFNGSYDTYQLFLEQEEEKKRTHISTLKKERRALTKIIQSEQERAAHSRKAHAHENDRKLKGYLTMKGESTAARKAKQLNTEKERITDELATTRVTELRVPTFDLTAYQNPSKTIVTIQDGCIKYTSQDTWLLSALQLRIGPTDRVAILGNNGSGKSTLIKALLKSPTVITDGTWLVPDRKDIGYLDQNYETLIPEVTVFDTIKNIKPEWTTHEIRKHLNSFLFSKNEEVSRQTKKLSLGEKARLSLAQIAAHSPQLLILDELTNNLDLTVRAQVIQVLKAYPGAVCIISHDTDLLNQLSITYFYVIQEGRLTSIYH